MGPDWKTAFLQKWSLVTFVTFGGKLLEFGNSQLLVVVPCKLKLASYPHIVTQWSPLEFTRDFRLGIPRGNTQWMFIDSAKINTSILWDGFRQTGGLCVSFNKTVDSLHGKEMPSSPYTVDGRNPKQPPSDVSNPVNNGRFSISTGAGILPSPRSRSSITFLLAETTCFQPDDSKNPRFSCCSYDPRPICCNLIVYINICTHMCMIDICI